MDQLHIFGREILNNSTKYEVLYGITRNTFIRIYHLYKTLSFLTAVKHIHKDFKEPLGDTPGADYRKVAALISSGVDLETLINDSFPSLKIENSLFVQ